MIALRPLSIGEIVDRAVNVGVRNARWLAMVAGLPTLVATTVSTFVLVRVATFGRLWDSMTGHPSHTTYGYGPAPAARFAILFAVVMIASFVTAAIAAGFASTIEGRALDPRASASAVGARWPAIAGLGVVAFFVHLPESVLINAHSPIDALLVLPFETWFALLVALAVCAVAVEGVPFDGAFGAAFRWVGGSGRARSWGIALALLAFGLAVELAETAIAAAVFAVHASWALLPAIAVFDTIASVVGLLVVVVYYFDCRVVRDGLGIV